MRSDVHASALRSAAKVAFSVAFLGGCSAAPAMTAGEDPSAPAPTGASCQGSAPTKPAASCASVVAAAFPTEGDYPGVKQSVSSEVQACCIELLDESKGSLADHRWDCCANLPDPPPANVGIACTPWGPPVPPAMRASRRVRAVA